MNTIQQETEITMNPNIKPVTKENRKDVLALTLAPGQERFLEPIQQCLSEADRRKNWRPVGIYDGDTLIGFAMYGYFRLEYFPLGKLWLDRFMIDQNYQGRGYGKTALKALIARLKSEYRCTKIYLSIIPGNHTAAKLYTQFGFQFNGKKDINGEQIMVLNLS